jgi:uncharacterized protein
MKKILSTFSAIVFCTLFTSTIAFGHSTSIVISHVYGGGGAGTSTFKKDFVELKNVSNAPQSTAGLSIAYASATGQFASVPANAIALTPVTLSPGQHFLVLLGTAGTAGADIINFDQTTTNLNMAAAAGKVALVTAAFVQNTCGATATPCALSSTSPSALGIVDLVAYGTPNNAEGGAGTVVTSATLSAVRAAGGCTDSDRNSADFTVGAATVPNYTGTAFASCNILDITTANSMPNGAVGVAYTSSFVSLGGNGTYTYSVPVGAVPTGLTLNPNGTWSGMPSAGGTFNFDVQVTDTTAFRSTFSNLAKFSQLNPNTTTESFQIIITAPTAASANVSGRVVNTSGRALSRTSVSLLNTRTGEVRYARTNSFGYFNILDLEVGDFYIMNAARKGYEFPQTSFQLFENLEGLMVVGSIQQ